MTEPTYVPIAGLRVPAQLVPRIIAAMRGIYPTVTGDLTDDAAVRAVLKHWVTSTLSAYEASEAVVPVAETIEAIQAEAEESARLAREKAEADAATISEAPPA